MLPITFRLKCTRVLTSSYFALCNSSSQSLQMGGAAVIGFDSIRLREQILCQKSLLDKLPYLAVALVGC